MTLSFDLLPFKRSRQNYFDGMLEKLMSADEIENNNNKINQPSDIVAETASKSYNDINASNLPNYAEIVQEYKDKLEKERQLISDTIRKESQR